MSNEAIICGPIPKLRNVDRLAIRNLTRGERVIRFAHDNLVVPEGIHVGKKLKLDPFQQAFILSIFDNRTPTTLAILSIARRNGKTFLVAVILLAFIIGPEAVENSTLASAAMSREQAALVHGLMTKMLHLSPKVRGRYKIIPSTKRIFGLSKNVEYLALAADAKTGHGKALLVVLLDEAGQIKGPQSDYVDMLVSSQGSYEKPLFIVISTQAPTDADLLSTWIDAAATSGDPATVCHVYTVPEEAEIDDKTQWVKANPGIGRFRSYADVEKQAKKAKEIPASEAGFRNLILNQRISLERLWMGPSLWKLGAGLPDMDAFRQFPVVLGLDLSSRQDLTAAVASVTDDDGLVHVVPFVFTPMQGLAQRARRDRAPYEQWVSEGKLIAVPGPTVDYDWVCEFLIRETNGWNLRSLAFDRWRIDDFKRSAEDKQLRPEEWEQVGQGYKDFSPRMERFEEELVAGKIRHGMHPLLTMSASNAIAVADPAGNRKLDKSKSTLRIDPLVAAVMSVSSPKHHETAGVQDGSFMIL